MDLLLQHYRKERNEKSIRQIVTEVSLLKVRPVLMTTATTIFALFAIMFSTGAGSEVMKPIAAPTVGGLITATLLNLIIVPVLFAWTEEKKEDKWKLSNPF